MTPTSVNDIFEIGECLDVQLLQKYTAGKLDKASIRKVEKHLVSCELCSLAVEGASAIAITTNDISDIEQKIETKYSSTQNYKGFHLSILILSGIILTATIIFFLFFNSNQKKDIPLITNRQFKNPDKKIPSQEISNSDTVENLNTKKEHKLSLTAPHFSSKKTKATSEIGTLQKRELFLQTYSTSTNPLDNKKPSLHNNEIIYLHNCKVVMLKGLYYTDGREKLLERNTPSPLEKKQISGDRSVKSQIAIAVLEKGLMHFNTKNYKQAYDELLVLTEHNPNDINAAFYSALCSYEIGNTKVAKATLNKLLKNTYFGEEATWYYSLSLMKERNYKEAKYLLQEIIVSGGFYAESAKEKLTEIE